MFTRARQFFILFFLVTILPGIAVVAQTKTDSSKTLQGVTITAEKKPQPYSSLVPVQILNHEALQQISSESIAGAAKYFSGVLIKDYGGVGGLKTISVRSLGGLNTGLVYDGITIADAQTGQLDLSKFSSTFVQTLELDQSNPQQQPMPARVYASASILAFTSNAFNTMNFSQTKWKAGVNAGSFGLWQPFAGIYLPVTKDLVVSATGEATWAKGDYPYYFKNGMFSEKKYRSNSDIRSFQGEVNIVNRFRDSSTLQTKVWAYNSERGLPGSIVYFNDISVQRLQDQNFFAQTRYLKKFSSNTSLLLSAKYSSLITTYTDPNFLNNAGGLNDRYVQNEIYGSAALSHRVGNYFLFAFASDIASTHLSSNIPAFANPTRLSLWNNFTIQFAASHWQVNASLLNTNISDNTVNATPASNKNKFTPAFAIGYRTAAESPWLFRFFYKDIFRMPSFNDLYYTYISSINPILRPEYSSQWDAGITYSKTMLQSLKHFNISVDAYYNTIKDKIIAVPSSNLFVWTMVNLGKVHIRGLDLNAEANGNFISSLKWSARVAYTYQQAIDVTNPSSAQYKNQIPYTPSQSGSALAVMYYQIWSFGYNLLFSGDRYTLGENNSSNQLPYWNTQDLFLACGLNRKNIHTTIKAEINNIFNQDYDVIRYYPMPGRSYKISLTFYNL